MTLVECNYYAWSMHLCVCRSVYAHGTEVVVSFYFTHTRIAKYCIPDGHVSATLSRACMKGAGHENINITMEDC